MSVTSKLKRGVDLPMWEWLRPLPVATVAPATGPSTFATGGKPYGRYIYYLPHTTNPALRYDIYTDGWTTITNPPQTQSSVASTRYNDYHGYSGRMISATLSGFTAGVPKGNKCVGKVVRIVSGTGAGQTRTITAVSDPTVHDIMTVSSASTLFITDSTKSYALNQWRDYGARIVTNLATDFRKIIYSTSVSVVLADNRFSSVGLPWAYSPLPSTTVSTDGSETRVQIESHDVSIDQNWTVTPDNTSVFVIQSGMLWNLNVSVARFGFQSYDILNDNWYQNNSFAGGMLAANIATDAAIESLNESAVGVLASSTFTGVSSGNTWTTTISTFTTNQYANYIVRIVGGTGIGQDRIVISNTSNTITINRKWNTPPDGTSLFEIVADNDKLYMTGAAGAAMFEYDALNDVWSDRRILEVGCPTNLCAVWSGYKRPIGISTITRSGTTATVTTTNSHGLKTGDSVTVYGATDALYNITAAVTVTGDLTFTYTMAGTPAANAAAAFSQSATTLVDPSKSWTVNELVGDIVSFTTTAYTQSGGLQTNYYHRIITANTATTITFASGTTPTANTTVYLISDMRCHGGVFASQLTGTPSATVVTTVSGGMATNVHSGLRAVVIDGANWGEVSIASNTANTITFTGTGLAFTPTTAAFVTVLGVAPTGAGCSLEYMYNTSTKQKGRYMFGMRGGATNYMYLYDITSNTWEVLNQMPNSETFTTGTMTAYDGDDRIYIQRDATGRVLYYDFNDNNLYSYNTVPFGMSTATLGNKMSIIKTEDGLKFLYMPRHTGSEFWRSLLWI